MARLVEEGLESEQRRRERFLDVAKRSRAAKDLAEADRLGDELSRMVLGGWSTGVTRGLAAANFAANVARLAEPIRHALSGN